MTSPLATLVLADDHPDIRSIVASLVASRYEVVAEAENGVEAIEAVAKHIPNVVILDVAMPLMNGFGVAREIVARKLPTKIVFLSVQGDAHYLETARDMGASYVLKKNLYSQLLPAIEETLAGRSFIAQNVGVNRTL